MNREADEKLRQAVREWLKASPAAGASLHVDGAVFVRVGTEAQLREVTPRRPLPDHVLREVVNRLRDTALQFHAAGQLRERLRAELDPLLEHLK